MAGTVAVAGGTEGMVGRGVMGVMTSRTSMSAVTMGELGHDEL